MSATARRYRRTFHRERQVLRDNGCTCDATITRDPRSTWAPGVTEQCTVVHQLGCPLGFEVSIANALGREPGLYYGPPSECGR